MPSRWARTTVVITSLFLAGCAGYRPAPLTASHPADPGAPAAPEPAASTTLAYAPSDVPSARPTPPPARGGEQGSRTVVGEGEIVAIQPSAGQIVLEHGELKGFMDAMTMGYRIDPPSLLAGLKPGDKVRFTIDVGKRTITRIEKLRAP